MVELSNPFAHAIVTDAWQPPKSDVPLIHAAVFDLCKAMLEQVRESGGSRSVLLHGLPGSGKTHLLARFRTHLTGAPRESAPAPAPSVLFIAVRLRSGARMLCRHLRRTLATDLFRPTRLGMSQLEQLLLYRFGQHLRDRKKAQSWWLELRQPRPPRRVWFFGRPGEAGRAEREVEAMMEWLDDQATLGRNLSAALRELALGRHRRDVRDWLYDGALPEAAMREMGLVPAPEDEDPEEQALDMVCAVSRLADTHVPLVLCFDQVEALQTSPEDLEGLFAFGRMVSALHDKTRNTLLISCVQTAFLDRLDEVIRGADMDRLAEREGLLKPLDREEAERLVVARLDASPTLARMRKGQANPLWPLKPGRLAELMEGNPACTPRQLISFCEEEYEKWRQGQAQPAETVDEFLAIQYRLEAEQALRAGDPQRMDEVLAHGLPLVLPLLGKGRQVVDPSFKYVDLIIELGASRVHLSFCNQVGNQFTVRLARLRAEVEGGRLPNLVLLRDSRLPISRYARKGQEHIEALSSREVPFLRPAPEVLAAIESFRSLWSDAKAGDLAKRGEAVSVEAVEQWFKGHLPDPIASLVEELRPRGGRLRHDALYDELLELVQRARVIPLSEAAQTLRRETAELEAFLARYHAQFGVLQGPPVVIYERAAGTVTIP